MKNVQRPGCRACEHPQRRAIDAKLKDGISAATVRNWTKKHRGKKGPEWGEQLGLTVLRAHRIDCLGLPVDPSRVAAPAPDPIVAKLDDPEYVPADAEISAATRRALLKRIGDLSGKELAALRLQELKTEEARLRVEEKQGKGAKSADDEARADLAEGVRGALGHIRQMRRAG